MKRLIIVVSTLLVAACASEPAKEQPGAAVEDRAEKDKPQVVDRPPVKPAQPSGLPDKSLIGKELTDPKSILSKRSIFFYYDSNIVKDEYKPLVTANAHYLHS